MYDRKAGDDTLTFRFNPGLLKENLLFDDLETGSVWSQLAQEAVKGPLEGTPLKTLASVQTTWKIWHAMHPETLVLSPRLGLSEEPYQYASGEALDRESLRGLPARERVLAVRVDTVRKAYPFSELKKAGGKIQDEIQGKAIFITYDEKSASAAAWNQNRELMPSIIAYWKNWVSFYPETLVYKAAK